jgi:hypothetical protein
MAQIRDVFAVLVLLVGLVFVGQGLGLIRGQSFMVDDIRWTLIGAGMVIVAVGILVWGRLGRR